MLKARIVCLLVALLTLAGVGQQPKNVAAVVIGLKGSALVKSESKDDPPSRQWTKLKLLQTISAGAQLKVPAGSQMTLSFAIGARKVTLDGEVTVNVGPDNVAIVNGTSDRLKESLSRTRQAVLAPKDRVDFSRMGGVSARAAYVNVRTDLPRPLLSVALIQKADGSTFRVPEGAKMTAFYRIGGKSGRWTESSVVGGAGERLVPQWDLEPGTAYEIQLLAPPTDDRQIRDYWVYRYTPEELADLDNAIATQATTLEMLFFYRDYHLFDRAFAALQEAKKSGDHDGEALTKLEEELKIDESAYQKGTGG